MDNVEKVLIGVGVVLVFTVFYFGVFYGEATGEVVGLEEEINGHHTVAVCNGSGYCQDWEVVCENESLVEMRLVEGADFQQSEGWVDLRSEEEKRLCG